MPISVKRSRSRRTTSRKAIYEVTVKDRFGNVISQGSGLTRSQATKFKKNTARGYGVKAKVRRIA